ncbi:MAG: S41 family peptidase [Alphaproteobacteria bacterium]|nr:S41 family peptidase [Alphaproteobacteria bacterium]NCQ87977.1 S41 family peptidase [Alphaproteobacteria bacterium]NCT05516.1 S41 family peptidase [Alphaproteobacteria bacterium]
MPSQITLRLFGTLIIFLMGLSGYAYAQAQVEESEERTVNRSVEDQTRETYRQLNLLGDIFERVRGQYVEEVTDEQLVKNAINGMLTNLDPHSSYLDEKDFDDMRVNTRGEFGGLGIEVGMENGFVKVVSPIDETPAYRAGMQAGDFITHIDEEPVMGLTLSEAVDKMRGKVGEPILLTVVREGEEEPFDVKIIRDVIKIRSVRNRVEQDDIGYVRITTFNQNTMTGVEAAIAEIKKEVKEPIGYVIDLRNNPGGLLDQAIAVSDAFLDKGEIVSTRGRLESDTKRDNATLGDLTDGKPIIVLINGGSASASEIVAGALQDHRRAILLGTQSFGKGSVQTVIPIPGHGAIRLTTARYYTPSGRSIQAEGIIPDIIVEPAKIEKIEQTRHTSENDLKGALDQKEKKQKTNLEDDAQEEEKPVDYQLSRAIDLLRGMTLYEDRFLENMRQSANDNKKK